MRCPRCRFDNSETQRFCGSCGTLLEAAAPPESDASGSAGKSADRARQEFTRTLETPAAGLASGALFAGRYRIIEELGQGGMGRVFRAFDRILNEEVALKLVRPEIGSDEKTLERFRNELKLARRISHRHVGRMYELLEEGGTFFITMEYVPGEDLKSLLRRVRQLAPSTAVAVAREIAEGLTEAHRLGVVHRDLKPSNVMIDKEGNARIMDFGIARSAGRDGLTGEGLIIGTPEYMSPEQADGKDVDRRSDIYSLGTILYEMVTGRTPFEGETSLAVILKQKSEPPLDPRKLNPQVPAKLGQLILRCLEKEPARRFQSAEEFLSEISRVEMEMPTAERAAPLSKSLTSREITVKFGIRKALLWAAGLIFLVAMGAALWRLLGRGRSPSVPAGPPSLAVIYFNNNTGDPALDYLRAMLADAFTADLTQSRFIEVLSREALVQILKDLNQLDARSFSADILKRVASEGRVNHLLVGDYAKAGDIIRIHVALQNAGSGKTVASELAEGRGVDSIFGLVDELCKKVKTDLSLSAKQISADIDRNVGEITTKNLEAYKYYLEGRRYFDSGEFRKAIALYEQALKLDPEYAMVFRGLAICYYDLGLEEISRKYRMKALEFKDRISDRERYQLAGDTAYASERTFPQAIEMYGKLLDLYPQSDSANNNTGNIFFLIENWDQAAAFYEACVRNRTKFVSSYEYLSATQRARGLNDQALETLRVGIQNIGDTASLRFGLAQHFICRGEFDAANRELDKAISLDPTHFYNFYYRGVTSFYLEKWDQSEKEFRRLLEEKEPEAWYRGHESLYALALTRGRTADALSSAASVTSKCREVGVRWAEAEGHNLAAYVHLLAGRPDQAVGEAEAAGACAAEADRPELERAALHYRGLAQVAKKSFGEARKTADELKRRVEASIYKKDIRRYEHLMGMIALGEGRWQEAVPRFERAVSELAFAPSLYTEDHHILEAFYLEPLAEAYYLSGEVDKARQTDEKIIGLTVGRYLYGDRYARSFYRLGVIAEKQGRQDEAAGYLRKFLTLWQNADVGGDERVDAEKRLAALWR